MFQTKDINIFEDLFPLLVVHFVLLSEKVFYTIYGIEISLSPPIFEPVQLTLQTIIGFKYLSTLCFNMLLSIDRAVKKRGLGKAQRLSSETSRKTILDHRVFILKSACCFLSK